MTILELAQLQPSKVRSSTELTGMYIQYFAEIFGYKPNCVGCTFSNDFNQFKNRVLGMNSIQETQTQNKGLFKMRNPLQIFTYTNESGRKVRTYGNKMTVEFAKQYLTIGTDAEIEQRKKEFAKDTDFDAILSYQTEQPVQTEEPVVEDSSIKEDPKIKQLVILDEAEEISEEQPVQTEEPVVEKRGRKKS